MDFWVVVFFVIEFLYGFFVVLFESLVDAVAFEETWVVVCWVLTKLEGRRGRKGSRRVSLFAKSIIDI